LKSSRLSAGSSQPSIPLSEALCPRYQVAVDLLGRRWTGLVLSVLLEGPQRFGALAAHLEVVSDRMLSRRLKELEAEGIVRRRVIPAAPLGVEYKLTAKGRALGGVVSAIESWAESWVPRPSGARRAERRPSRRR
jgi:DNA-binding HxlR family transcriptional regulator